MKYFDNPSAGFKVRIFFLLFLFFSARDNMWFILTTGHGVLLSRVASIKAKILWVVFCHFRAGNYNAVQSVLQQFAVMSVCSVQNNRQRKTVFIRQYAPFCSLFFPDQLDLALLRSEPMVLSPCSHLRFAIPSRSLSSHRILPVQLSRFSEKSRLLPNLENTCEDCCQIQILSVLPSIGSQSGAHRKFQITLSGNPVFSVPDQGDDGTASAGHVLSEPVSRFSLFPKLIR